MVLNTRIALLTRIILPIRSLVPRKDRPHHHRLHLLLHYHHHLYVSTPLSPPRHPLYLFTSLKRVLKMLQITLQITLKITLITPNTVLKTTPLKAAMAMPRTSPTRPMLVDLLIIIKIILKNAPNCQIIIKWDRRISHHHHSHYLTRTTVMDLEESERERVVVKQGYILRR